jgi:hypothetical protein
MTTVKNSDGETIEVRKSPHGLVEIRHHDIDKEAWGVFVDPKIVAPINPVKIAGQICTLNDEEIMLIRNAAASL